MAAAKSDGSVAAERPPLVIIVSRVQGSPGHYRAQLEGSDALLVQSSRQPFVDSARVLIARGHNGGTELTMRHAGSDAIALKAKLSVAAKLGVEEGPNGPRFVPYRTGPKSRVAASPMAKERRLPYPASIRPSAGLLHRAAVALWLRAVAAATAQANMWPGGVIVDA
jgi:hypothetical protein